ncbi:magnesium transporter CorA family protein [Thermosulfurimonas dismutans]|uniref:Magnesium and cobalt transport protein CorA n=1 Tax=Thermosulfurimonas dismutans TaxID=999894 RepID=A0A179D3I9_9BACT|nr:magnesium transporter CorA family protein [Thermosulfurimonas dismutans]OAQ20371.1 Magnesium and cobalt transport protein CorA [Thermosulfurimonas dismutans]
MLRIYRSENGFLVPAEKISPHSLVVLTAPTEEELHYMENKLRILPDFLKYPLDAEERPRIEVEEKQLLVIFHVPDPRHEGDIIRYETIPVGIILTDEAVVALCLKENLVFEEVLALSGKTFAVDLERPTTFIFLFFYCVANLYLRYLRLIDRLIDDYEAELHRSMRNRELLKILSLEKSLVYFNTALRGNDVVLIRIQSGRYLRLSEEDFEMLEDIQIENRQAMEMAKIYSDILGNTMDTYASIIGNNLNIVMKFLTAIAIVLALPTLISSIYGMNIRLPLQDNPHAFWILMGASFFLSGSVVAYFIKKRMF